MIVAFSGKKRSGKDTAAQFAREFIRDNYRRTCSIVSFAAPLKRLLNLFARGSVNVFAMETDEQKESTFLEIYEIPTAYRVVNALIDDHSSYFSKDIDPKMRTYLREHLLAYFFKMSAEEFVGRVMKSIAAFYDMVEKSPVKLSLRKMLQILGTDVFRNDFDGFWVKLTHLNIYNALSNEEVVLISDARFVDEFEFVEGLKGSVVRITRPSTDASGDNHVSETAADNYDFEHKILNDSDLDSFKRAVEDVCKTLFPANLE